MEEKLIEEIDKYVVRLNKEHSIRGERIQKLYKFDNGFGASVVKSPYTYGGTEDLWELAMLLWLDESEYELYYCDIVNDDVLGYLTDMDVYEALDKIKNYNIIEIAKKQLAETAS